MPEVSCSQCSTSTAIVFDRPTGRVARFCLSCQLMVPHDGATESRMVSLPIPLVTVIRFLEQFQFWSGHALPIIRAYADHFHSLDRCQHAATLLQSWQGGHLDSVAQEVVTPPNIMSMIEVWLDSVTQFRQGDSPQVLPGGTSDSRACTSSSPFSTSPGVPRPCHSADPPSVSFQAPSPFTVAPSPSPPPRSPFAVLPHPLPLPQGTLLTLLRLWLQDLLLSTLLHHLMPLIPLILSSITALLILSLPPLG